MSQLTETQQATLDFIREFINQCKIPPTMAEISNGMGWASPNNAALHVKSLQKKGYITVRRGASRGLALTNSATVNIPDVNSEEYWFDGVFQHRRYERDVYKVIEACGLKGSKKTWGNGQEVLNDH